MRVPFLDLRRHVASLRPELDAVFAATLDGGRFVGGRPVEAFEAAFADYCGAQHAVGVANGTDAIGLALRAVGVEPGDEVVTAANTCVPTVAGIEAAGAVPVLADADPETATLDAASAEAAVGPKTRAILPVHLYGRCADVGALTEVARRHGLRLVEDAAQAHGAEWRGRRAGSLGDAAAFSFYPTKNLGALGDGGAVVTSDAEVAERARMLRSYGERDRYESVLRGTNSRLDTIQAAVLLAKLPRLERWIERRRELAARYREALPDALQPPLDPDDGRHVYHLFVVRVPDRDGFRRTLDERGVETLVHYPRAVHQHAAYAGLGRAPTGLDSAERLADEVVSLPLFPELTDAEAKHVIEAVVGVRSAA